MLVAWALMTQLWRKPLRCMPMLPSLRALAFFFASGDACGLRFANALTAFLSAACVGGAASAAWGQSISTHHLVASYDHMTLTSGSNFVKTDCKQNFEGRAPTLVYVWSPRMVLSALHADVAQQQALAAGLAFMPLHDTRLGAEPAGQADRVSPDSSSPNSSSPNRSSQSASTEPAQSAPHTELAQTMQRLRQTQPSAAAALQHTIALCSAQLLQNHAQRHFPTAFVWNGSAFAQYPIVGAMPAAYWAQSIAQRLQASTAASAAASQPHTPPTATAKQGVQP